MKDKKNLNEFSIMELTNLKKLAKKECKEWSVDTSGLHGEDQKTYQEQAIHFHNLEQHIEDVLHKKLYELKENYTY